MSSGNLRSHRTGKKKKRVQPKLKLRDPSRDYKRAKISAQKQSGKWEVA